MTNHVNWIIEYNRKRGCLLLGSNFIPLPNWNIEQAMFLTNMQWSMIVSSPYRPEFKHHPNIKKQKSTSQDAILDLTVKILSTVPILYNSEHFFYTITIKFIIDVRRYCAAPIRRICRAYQAPGCFSHCCEGFKKVGLMRRELVVLPDLPVTEGQPHQG